MDEMQLLERMCLEHPGSTRTRVREWIKTGRVTVDGTPVTRTDTPVGSGQELRLEARACRQKSIQGIRIIYEDRYLVVVDKPAGLLSVATDNGKGRNLCGLLREHCAPFPVYAVHRLDRDTSGVLVFAKSARVRDLFREAFESREVKRLYMALAEGQFDELQGSWESYLSDDADMRVRSGKKRVGARWAKTHFKVVQQGKKAALLQLRLETGRKNQIRVHCAEAGHPLVGDVKYGAQTDSIGRLALHAEQLGFVHPMTGQPLEFKSPAPRRFLLDD